VRATQGWDALEIEHAGAERLAGIGYQAGSDGARSLADALKIDSAAIRPVTLRHSNDSGLGKLAELES
jgi:hypothetical protein